MTNQEEQQKSKNIPNSSRRGSYIYPNQGHGSDGPYGGPSYLKYMEDRAIKNAASTDESQVPQTERTGGSLSPFQSNTEVVQDGEAARAYKLACPLDLPGGPNHRPLVGGYAAAAYEAAKSLHYATVGVKDDRSMLTQNRTPPSI